jgi:hypothetical protein
MRSGIAIGVAADEWAERHGQITASRVRRCSSRASHQGDPSCPRDPARDHPRADGGSAAPRARFVHPPGSDRRPRRTPRTAGGQGLRQPAVSMADGTPRASTILRASSIRRPTVSPDLRRKRFIDQMMWCARAASAADVCWLASMAAMSSVMKASSSVRRGRAGRAARERVACPATFAREVRDRVFVLGILVDS